MRANINNLDDLFYTKEELIVREHHDYIYKRQERENQDIRLYKNLVNECFSTVYDRKPQKKSLDDIRIADDHSYNFYDARDIRSYFLSNEYEYPVLTQRFRKDIDNIYKNHSKEDVFKELLSQVASPGSAVAIIGDVGEGKSTLLQRFSIDLYNTKGKIKYFPVIVNIQNFITGLNDDEEVIELDRFWESVITDVLFDLESEMDIMEEIKSSNNIEIIHDAIKDAIKQAKDILSKYDTYSTQTYVRKILMALNQLSTRLIKGNIRLVLILDNIDAICYDHERYMLFERGYLSLRTRISSIKSIINNIREALSRSEFSLILTARPYVYSHIFTNRTHNTRLSITSVYMIDNKDPSIPIKSRLRLLTELTKHLLKCDFPAGKVDAINNHNKEFISIVSRCLKSSDEPYEKLYQLANQGFDVRIKNGQLKLA